MEILPRFWVSYYNNDYIHLFIKKKIKNIIHLSKTKSFLNKHNIEEIKVIIDYNENNTYEEQNMIMYQQLFDITDYIHEKLNNSESILLLGDESKQDIDTLIIAYFIRYGKLNIFDSIMFLKTKKKDIFYPKCLFYYSLNKFYNQLNNNY